MMELTGPSFDYSIVVTERDARGYEQEADAVMWTSVGGSRPDMWVRMLQAPPASEGRAVW